LNDGTQQDDDRGKSKLLVVTYISPTMGKAAKGKAMKWKEGKAAKWKLLHTTTRGAAMPYLFFSENHTVQHCRTRAPPFV
jgi:hypothetical protein